MIQRFKNTLNVWLNDENVWNALIVLASTKAIANVVFWFLMYIRY